MTVDYCNHNRSQESGLWDSKSHITELRGRKVFIGTMNHIYTPYFRLHCTLSVENRYSLLRDTQHSKWEVAFEIQVAIRATFMIHVTIHTQE